MQGDSNVLSERNVEGIISISDQKSLIKGSDNNIHFASENVLSRDWLLPEEDTEWTSL